MNLLPVPRITRQIELTDSADMKNEKEKLIKFKVMNNLLHITAVLDQPGLLENLVEKLASRRIDIGYARERVPKNWNPVEISSTEAYVSGSLSLSDSIDNNDPSLNIPFVTSMLFTCIKGKEAWYNLEWSSSLS